MKDPFSPFYLSQFHRQAKGTLFHEWKIKFDGRFYVYGIFDSKYLLHFNKDYQNVPFLYIGETYQIHQRACDHRYRLASKSHHNKYLSYKASIIGVENLMMVALEELDVSLLEYPERGQFIKEREKFYQDKFLNIKYA